MLNPNKIRQLLASAIVLAGISLAVVLYPKIHRVSPPAEPLPRLPENVDMSLHKIHFTETRNGVKKWDILADRAEYDKKLEITRLSGVRFVVTGDGKMGDIVLTADRADYHMVSKDVRLSGHVTARSGSGMEFTAGEAAYVAERALIHAPGQVRYTDKTMEVTGIGMDFHTETRNLHIFDQVKANISAKAARQ